MSQNKQHELGSGPIETKHHAQMNAIVRVLDDVFNGEERPRKTGFVLLVFPFGEIGEGRCNYISNGADRRDIVKLLREQANRFDVETQ